MMTRAISVMYGMQTDHYIHEAENQCWITGYFSLVEALYTRLSHAQHNMNLDVFYFRHTNRSIDEIRIMKTNLNSL